MSESERIIAERASCQLNHAVIACRACILALIEQHTKLSNSGGKAEIVARLLCYGILYRLFLQYAFSAGRKLVAQLNIHELAVVAVLCCLITKLRIIHADIG